MSEERDRASHRDSWLAIGLVLAWEISKSVVSALSRVFLGKTDNSVTALSSQEGSGRAADRIQPEKEPHLAHPEKWGAFFVFIAFAAAIAGGLGFTILYWRGGNNLLLGEALAIFFGGLGFGMVLYSHWLIEHKQAIEPREMMPSTREERLGAIGALYSGEHDAKRRGLLKWVGAATVAVFGAMLVSLFRSLGAPPGATLPSTEWKAGQRLMTIDNKPVAVDTLQPGSTVVVFPEDKIGSERAQAVLVRVDEQFLKLPMERATWAPQGYVAYSRVCTHAGCPVGMFEATTDLLMCPCHQSTFDVLRAALPTGGPAARPLPQLPLYADSEGYLRAAGGFTEPPGPGYWGMP